MHPSFYAFLLRRAEGGVSLDHVMYNRRLLDHGVAAFT